MKRPPIAVVLAGCAVAGAALGASGTGLLRAPAAEPPAPLPVIARVPLSVLHDPQRPADVAGVPAMPGLRRSTLHRVGTLSGDGVLLVGEDTAGGRCIVAVSPERGLFRAGCAPVAEFAAGGARVAWSTREGADHLTAEWHADGTVRAGPTPQLSTASGPRA